MSRVTGTVALREREKEVVQRGRWCVQEKNEKQLQMLK